MASSSPRRRRSCPDDIEESNSTANLFLGGVRRNWMSGSKHTAPDPPAWPQARARKDTPSRTNSSSAADPHAPESGSVRSAPADPALMSPVTPGTDTSQPASMPAAQLILAHVADIPGPQPTALPSPVPSTGSVSSPVVSYNHSASLHDGPDAAPRASNTPAISAQPATSYTPAVRSRPSSCPETEQDARQTSAEAVQMARHVGSHENHVQPLVTGSSPYHSPAMAFTGHSNANIRTPTDRRFSPSAETWAHPQSSGLILPNEKTWGQWRASLERMKRDVQNRSGIVWPRIMLLDDALAYRDLHYLLLHQLYCRRSVGTRSLDDFPAFQQGRPCLDGMDNLTVLIESNTKLSEELCRKMAEFPFQLHRLRREAWFAATFQEVLHCCHRLSKQPYGLTQQRLDSLSVRGYPPLVEEILNDSGARSPVLLNVIFASACRRLYDDVHLPTLNKLFRKDIHTNLRASIAVATEQHRSNMQMELIELYKQIPMKVSSESLLPQSPHPAPSVSQAQTMPMHATMPPSTSAQSSVVNPTLSAPANPMFASHPLQGMLVPHNPGYSQHQYSCSPQQARNTMGWRQPQTAALYSQVPTTSTPPPPQGQQALLNPGQFVSRRPSQPGYAPSPLQGQSTLPPRQSQPAPGQVVDLVHSGQPQWHINGQRYPSIPHAASPSVTSQLQRSNGQAEGRPHMSPRGASSLATQGVSTAFQRLLPPDGYRVPPTLGPNPMRLGLHQADLRDPVKKFIGQEPNGERVDVTELYHFANDFSLTPQFIDGNVPCYEWSFNLSEEDYSRLPRLHHDEPGQGQRPVQTLQAGCRTFRLRSVTMCDSEREDPTQSWFTKGTTWPSVFYIFVNGVEMFVRRKPHNGKDLPLDITKHLMKGENKVTVHFLLGPDECKDFRYAFGIERMITTTFEHARQAAKVIPVVETYQIIRKRLTPSEDDDVAFLTDSLTINLIDPFTAHIFQTPVSSMFCTHLECFDLDTFVKTCKSEPGPAPLKSNWRCPICHADARPQCLRINNFLILVRDELIRTRRLEAAQAIQVKADGTWFLKVAAVDSPPSSPVNGTSDPTAKKRKADTLDPDLGPSRPKTEGSPDENPRARSQGPVVIELD